MYLIIENYKTILGRYDNSKFEEAKAKCHQLRRNKYANHNILKELEYDRCPFDNGINLIKANDKPVF